LWFLENQVDVQAVEEAIFIGIMVGQMVRTIGDAAVAVI
jgi:hypothetical protein